MPRYSKHLAPPQGPEIDPLRDEVYRQMFRVESGRPQAELRLAAAMLKAWSALETLPANDERREWLRRVCPVCVRMIESMMTGNKSEQEEPSGKRSGGRRGEEHGS